MEILTVIATAVTAVATAMIAIYSYFTHRLTKDLNAQCLKNNDEMQDLLNALTISNMIHPQNNFTEHILAQFNAFYDGNMVIFNKNKVDVVYKK